MVRFIAVCKLRNHIDDRRELVEASEGYGRIPLSELYHCIEGVHRPKVSMTTVANKALGCVSEKLCRPIVLIKPRKIGKLRPAFGAVAKFGDVFQELTRFVV